jgi:uncharacterized membrane protein
VSKAATTSPARPQTLQRRLDNLVLRWQARLDSDSADRIVPWVSAVVLFVALGSMSLARARSLDAGADLASYLQGAWLVNSGDPAFSSITGTHLLSDQAGFIFYPLAWMTRLVPAVPFLLLVQSAALALGVVPLWRIARRVARLRAGAAATVLVAYSLYPALHNVNQADFHLAALALPALLAASLYALTDRWRLFALFAVLAVLCRADFGLVIAGMGGLLAIEGKRRQGAITAGVGLAWVLVALFVVQPYYADGAFVHASAFAAYGSSPLGVLGGMIAHPFSVLGDITAEENFNIVVLLLAPVVFLPVLAPRYLLPALPLELLYLVANASELRQPRLEQNVAITAFIFLATAMALSRIGTRTIDRVRVDRRVLGALLLAAIVFFVRDSATSPYRSPWDLGRQDAADGARLDAVDTIADDESVRASPNLLPLLAERHNLYELDTTEPPHVRRATADDVDVVVLDEQAEVTWDDDDRRLFHEGMLALGYTRAFNVEGIAVYRRG